VVGVHLGSTEKDLGAMARHFDQFPNVAVDTASRVEYLMAAPQEKVRDFLIKYQDRVLYGTDLDLIAGANPSDVIKEWQSTYILGLEISGDRRLF
jgi:predicted TIM-barrel fold metal-dependent hydrolase